MTNAELKELAFVLCGYGFYILAAEKLVMWILRKTDDKYMKVASGCLCCMFAMPISIGVLVALI